MNTQRIPEMAPLTQEQLVAIKEFEGRPQLQADIFESVSREVGETVRNFPDREM